MSGTPPAKPHKESIAAVWSSFIQAALRAVQTLEAAAATHGQTRDGQRRKQPAPQRIPPRHRRARSRSAPSLTGGARWVEDAAECTAACGSMCHDANRQSLTMVQSLIADRTRAAGCDPNTAVRGPHRVPTVATAPLSAQTSKYHSNGMGPDTSPSALSRSHSAFSACKHSQEYLSHRQFGRKAIHVGPWLQPLLAQPSTRAGTRLSIAEADPERGLSPTTGLSKP